MPSDNTFAGARSLGSYTGRKPAQTFVFKGDLSRGDRVDIFRLTFKARASYRSSLTTGKVQGGGFRVTGFGQVPGLTGVVRVPEAAIKIRAGNPIKPIRSSVRDENPTDLDIIVYFRLDQPTGRRVKYNIRLTYRR